MKIDILSGQRKSYTHGPSVLWVFHILFCMFSLSPPSLSAAVVLNRHHGIYSCPKKRRKKRRKKNFQRRRYAALRLQWQVVKVKKKKKKKNQLKLKTWSWRPSDVAFRCKDRSASHRRRITSYTSSSCSRSLPRKIADSSYFRVAWTNMIPRRTDEKYCRRVRPSRAMADKFSATLCCTASCSGDTSRRFNIKQDSRVVTEAGSVVHFTLYSFALF